MSLKEFFESMMSETGKVSSKRWIGITTAAVLLWVITYSTLKAANASERLSIIVATMLFVIVVIGVATLPQVVSLIRGTTVKEEEKKEGQ